MKNTRTFCRMCGDVVAHKRSALGYKLCLLCGDEMAHQRKFTIACNNKQGYELITDLSMLKQLNPKRTT
jgi:ribosomal protein L37AE/L43A